MFCTSKCLPVGCTPTRNPPLTARAATPRWVPLTRQQTTTESPSATISTISSFQSGNVRKMSFRLSVRSVLPRNTASVPVCQFPERCGTSGAKNAAACRRSPRFMSSRCRLTTCRFRFVSDVWAGSTTDIRTAIAIRTRLRIQSAVAPICRRQSAPAGRNDDPTITGSWRGSL
jgi:hypothetical protein